MPPSSVIVPSPFSGTAPAAAEAASRTASARRIAVGYRSSAAPPFFGGHTIVYGVPCMARAPETGFYFEPIAERLALVLEGSAFPSEEAWAYIGDPVKMPLPLRSEERRVGKEC